MSENADKVLDAIITNEPDVVVDAFQELIQAKAEEIVASRVGLETEETPTEGEPSDQATE